MSSGQWTDTTTREVECDGVSGHTVLAGTPLSCKITWPCTFTGEVDVDVDPESRSASWECPACGTTHEVDFDTLTEPDPDDLRDRWLDGGDAA